MPICELYNLQDWINVNDLYDEFHIISTAVLLHKTNDFYIHMPVLMAAGGRSAAKPNSFGS